MVINQRTFPSFCLEQNEFSNSAVAGTLFNPNPSSMTQRTSSLFDDFHLQSYSLLSISQILSSVVDPNKYCQLEAKSDHVFLIHNRLSPTPNIYFKDRLFYLCLFSKLNIKISGRCIHIPNTQALWYHFNF